MQCVKTGDMVTVEYVGTTDDGEIFETTEESGALEFLVGRGEVLPAFEKAVMDMKPGETRTVTLQPEEAYGQRLEELIQTLDRLALGEGARPKAGMVYGLTVEHQGRSHQVPALVTAVMGERVTVDFNHPLAGKTLVYTITVTAIDQAPAGSQDQQEARKAGPSGSGGTV